MGTSLSIDSVFVNHQRIRQYEGGHFENWGGVSLEIDCNVLDGVVAVRTDAVPPVSNKNITIHFNPLKETRP
jgi:hypothetical protein